MKSLRCSDCKVIFFNVIFLGSLSRSAVNISIEILKMENIGRVWFLICISFYVYREENFLLVEQQLAVQMQHFLSETSRSRMSSMNCEEKRRSTRAFSGCFAGSLPHHFLSVNYDPFLCSTRGFYHDTCKEQIGVCLRLWIHALSSGPLSMHQGLYLVILLKHVFSGNML